MNSTAQHRDVFELEKIIIDLTTENLNLRKQINSPQKNAGNILFIDFMYKWLEAHSISVRDITRYSYLIHIEKHFEPYFRNKSITLANLTTQDIEEYCKYKMDNGLGANTVRKHFATIRAALNYALKHKMVEYNVALTAELPSKTNFLCNVLTFDELNYILEFSKSEAIYPAILLAGILGLRRSEAVGLKWDCIDFTKHCVHINSTFIQCYANN